MGHNVSVKVASEGDDWETDPDFEVEGNVLSLPIITVNQYSVLYNTAYISVRSVLYNIVNISDDLFGLCL